jgi:hypothetical protein
MKYLPSVCPENQRALTTSIHSSVVGLLGGISPILWGLALRPSGAESGMHVPIFLFFLCFSVLLLWAAAFWASRLVYPDTDPNSIISRTFLLRSFRFTEGMVRFGTPPPTPKPPDKPKS